METGERARMLCSSAVNIRRLCECHGCDGTIFRRIMVDLETNRDSTDNARPLESFSVYSPGTADALSLFGQCATTLNSAVSFGGLFLNSLYLRLK